MKVINAIEAVAGYLGVVKTARYLGLGNNKKLHFNMVSGLPGGTYGATRGYSVVHLEVGLITIPRIVHELGHVVDYHAGRPSDAKQWTDITGHTGTNPDRMKEKRQLGMTKYARQQNKSAREDYAETFAYLVLGSSYIDTWEDKARTSYVKQSLAMPR